MSSFGLRFLVLIFVSLLCVLLVFYATWFLCFWRWEEEDFSNSLNSRSLYRVSQVLIFLFFGHSKRRYNLLIFNALNRFFKFLL